MVRMQSATLLVHPAILLALDQRRTNCVTPPRTSHLADHHLHMPVSGDDLSPQLPGRLCRRSRVSDRPLVEDNRLSIGIGQQSVEGGLAPDP